MRLIITVHSTAHIPLCRQGHRLLSRDSRQAAILRLTACAADTAAKRSRAAAAGRKSSGNDGDSCRSCAMRPSSCAEAASTLTANSCS
jgi:hypothetical protein